MNENRILALFKFGERRYMDDFVRGLLYMNTLEHFANTETSLIRRDSKEGSASWIHGKLSMKIDGEYREIPNIQGPLSFSHPHNRRANIFCMHALRSDQARDLVDAKNLQFGNTFVLLRDGDEFLRRVEIAAQSTGQQLQCGLVQYVDEVSYDGPIGPFRKSSAFSYQSEFRIALLPGMGAPYSLHIGDLSDIVAMGSLENLNSALKIEGEAGQERLLAALS